MNRELLSIALLALFLSSCSSEACSARAGLREDPNVNRPMRPMAYTEYLEGSPEGTAVREQRIARALLDGAKDEEWGAIQGQKSVDLSSAKKLQEALVAALFGRDERLWDALFIEAEDYSNLIHVDAEQAQRFVDGIQADSLKLWKTFEPESASDGLPGGFADVFEVEPLKLGAARTLSGRLVTEGEQGQQFWGSNFLLKWKRQSTNEGSGAKPVEEVVAFKVYLPKIIRIRSAGVTKYQLASPVTVESSIELFLKTGLHLKPQLMRSTDYPIPLTVGNYWRYRRYIGERKTEIVDPFKLEADDDAVMMVDATRAVDEIVRVDDYIHWKLVEMRRSHNDTELTKFTRWWLVFPRGIYLCNRYCRLSIQSAHLLLRYIADRVPIYVFPISSHMEWKAHVQPTPKKSRRSKIKTEEEEVPPEINKITTSSREPLTTAAGTFETIIRMTGPASLDTFPVSETGVIDRDFVWGKGVVRRFSPDENLTEELIELRVR